MIMPSLTSKVMSEETMPTDEFVRRVKATGFYLQDNQQNTTNQIRAIARAFEPIYIRHIRIESINEAKA